MTPWHHALLSILLPYLQVGVLLVLLYPSLHQEQVVCECGVQSLVVLTSRHSLLGCVVLPLAACHLGSWHLLLL